MAYSPDGSRIVSGSADKTLKVWDAKTGHLLKEKPELVPGNSRVVIHQNRRAYADGNLVRIERIPSWAEQLEKNHINSILRARADREFHEAEAERTRVIDLFACVFHLDRLLALSPEDRSGLLKRRTTVLLATLKNNADDHWAARSLARQVIADPDTIADLQPLLLSLSRHQHAGQDRLYGALLLRTGKARDAAIVLRAAIRNRTHEQPPIDELLLSLACVKLNRHDEARMHLRTAVAWMDRADQPIRATSLVGLASGNPFAALGALVHTPPDPRLNPLDPFTGHELRSLRAEVEKALNQR